MKKFITSAADGFFLLLAVLMPLKLGTLALMPETSNFFPESFFDSLIVSWSSNLFGAFSGIALLLQLAAAAAERKNTAFNLNELFFILLPLLGSIPGFFRAENPELALLYLIHFLSLSSFFAAAALYSRRIPEAGKRFFTALTAGTLILGFLGLHQYFFGFQELRDYVAEQQKNGMILPEAIMARVNDNRVYATFTSCNNLAGYLLLTIPPAAAVIWLQSGEKPLSTRSRQIFTLLLTAMLAAVLLLTKSRAAYLSLAVGAAAAVILLFKFSRKLKIALIVIIALGIAGGAFYIHHRGRGFLSMEARADYIRTSVIMLGEHPFAGAGWGGFFYQHMQKKLIDSAEAAHDPHNIFLSFASQAGILGLSAAMLMLLTPVWLLFREKKRSVIQTAALIGGGLWILHSMMDVNFLYPASFGMFGGVMIFACRDCRCPRLNLNTAWKKAAAGILPAIIAAGALWGSCHAVKGEYLLYQFTREPFASPGEERRAFEKLQQARPYSSVPYFVFGDMLLKRGDFAAAGYCFLEAAKLEPSRPMLYHRLAIIAEKYGEKESAGKYRAKCRNLFPRNPDYANY